MMSSFLAIRNMKLVATPLIILLIMALTAAPGQAVHRSSGTGPGPVGYNPAASAAPADAATMAAHAVPVPAGTDPASAAPADAATMAAHAVPVPAGTDPAAVPAASASIRTMRAGQPTGQRQAAGAQNPAAGLNPTSYLLYGDAVNTTGTGTTNFDSSGGGWVWNFNTTPANFIAVNGWGLGTNNYGVRGVGTVRGVYGEARNTSGESNGVRGETLGTCTSCNGVYGGSGYNGVYGSSNVASGNGVQGVSNNNGGSAYGVWGLSNSGYGVVGGGGPTGVYGTGTTYGVQGYGSTGVYGVSSGTTVNDVGVAGAGAGSAGRGVVGTSVGGIALLGASTSGSGFYGSSNNGPGGVLQSSTSVGVYAETYSTNSYALVTGSLANAHGNVYIDGHVYATGGCCATVQTSAGNREMYAIESTQNTFSDHGTATLVAGRAVVTIDPLFTQAANLSVGYQVFLTPGSADTAGLAVINKTATSFEVRELNKGQGTFTFDWQVLALQRGHESDRMQVAPAPPPAPPVASDAFTLPQRPPAAQPSKNK